MSNTTDQIIFLQSTSRIVLVSIGLPMFLLGIIGNLFNCLIFAYHPQFNKLPSSIFLFTSFIASEVDLIAGFLPQLVYRMSGTNPLISHELFCKLRWFVAPSSGTAALNCICLASINQYLITSHRNRYYRLITRRRAILLSAFVLLFCFAMLSPTMIYYSHITNSDNVTICGVANPTYASYILYESIITYSVIPIVVLSFFSLLTWCNIRDSLIRQRDLEQSLTRMLLAQSMLIFLTATPNIFNQIYNHSTRTMHKSALRLAEEDFVSTIATLFGFSSHSFGFYTYILVSETFCRTLRSTVIRNQPQEQMKSIFAIEHEHQFYSESHV